MVERKGQRGGPGQEAIARAAEAVPVREKRARVRKPRVIRSVSRLPFDPRSEKQKVLDGLPRRRHQRRRRTEPEPLVEVRQTAPPTKGILYKPEPGDPVNRWLAEWIELLDYRGKVYAKYVPRKFLGSDPDNAYEVVEQEIYEVAEDYFGEQLMAQLVVAFRCPSKGSARREPVQGLKVYCRHQTVLVEVSSEIGAMNIAPGGASALNIINMSRREFGRLAKQIEKDWEDESGIDQRGFEKKIREIERGVNYNRVVMLARRRVARADMQ